jgi:hypothetical protein
MDFSRNWLWFFWIGLRSFQGCFGSGFSRIWRWFFKDLALVFQDLVSRVFSRIWNVAFTMRILDFYLVFSGFGVSHCSYIEYTTEGRRRIIFTTKVSLCPTNVHIARRKKSGLRKTFQEWVCVGKDSRVGRGWDGRRVHFC